MSRGRTIVWVRAGGKPQALGGGWSQPLHPEIGYEFPPPQRARTPVGRSAAPFVRVPGNWRIQS